MAGFDVSSKLTTISAPCVTSGSSPPSLITEQDALFFPNSFLFIGILIRSFFGSKTSTVSIFSWLIIDRIAAIDAAVALVPVVNPVLSLPEGFSSMSILCNNDILKINCCMIFSCEINLQYK